MMRVTKVRRVLDVQKQMQRAAEWTLHELRQEQNRLQLAQQDIVTALSREDELGIWLAPALTRQLGRLATEADSAAVAGERQADLVLEQTILLKQAERLERALGKEDDREQEKTGLADLADSVIGGGRAKLP